MAGLRVVHSRLYGKILMFNHSYDYKPNWTSLNSITIISQNYNKILESDWISTDAI